jgi:hypothetical protein
MDFELVELPQDTWDIYLNMISSHSNMTSIPGRCLRLAVLEKKTKKWVGFIRLGSPVINMKPRNEMLVVFLHRHQNHLRHLITHQLWVL